MSVIKYIDNPREYVSYSQDKVVILNPKSYCVRICLASRLDKDSLAHYLLMPLMAPNNEFYDDTEFQNYLNKRKTELLSELQIDDIKEVSEENEIVMRSQNETMIVHFYSDKFEKCKIMNTKLPKVAKSFPAINFYKIKADKCRFLAEKLQIRVLPHLSFFRDGYLVQTIQGFEGFGIHDFETERLVEIIERSDISRGLKFYD